MKVAILALFACVAVSHAAFTANLVQRAQPALKQALFKVRLAGGRSELQTEIGQTLEQHANDLMVQIQNAVTTGSNMASALVAELQSTWEQMQNLGSGVWNSGSDILGGFVSNLGSLFGGLFGRQKSLGSIVDFVQNFDINEVITTITNTIEGLIAQATNLVANLNLEGLLSGLLSGLTGRGLFTDISNLAGSAWENIQSIFSQVTTVAGNAFDQVQALAAEFVADASQNIHQITSNAAADFLSFIKPYQQDLGHLYNQVVAAVGQIGKN